MQILINTPVWVYILFLFLLFLGIMQTKDRVLTIKKVFILPIILLVLSFFGTISAFGIDIKAVLLWLIGVVLGSCISLYYKIPKNVTYNKLEKNFFVKGSFLPLILIMIIFFLKYFVGVTKAVNPELLNKEIFIIIVSSMYGILSGIFFGRIFLFSKKMKD